jgi:hypothetical protein
MPSALKGLFDAEQAAIDALNALIKLRTGGKPIKTNPPISFINRQISAYRLTIRV